MWSVDTCSFRVSMKWLFQFLNAIRHASSSTRRHLAHFCRKLGSNTIVKLYFSFCTMLPRWGRQESAEQRDYRKLMEYNQLMKVRCSGCMNLLGKAVHNHCIL